MFSGGSRLRYVLAGSSAVVVLVAAVLWLSPSTLQAAGAEESHPPPVTCGIHPAFTGASFREEPGGDWRLSLGLRWTCAGNQNGVRAATGTVRLWSQLDEALEFSFPCRVNALVEPGRPLMQQVAVDWEEQSPVHEWLRSASAIDVRSSFVPDWVELTPMAESEAGSGQGTDVTNARRRGWRRGGTSR
jgi:hypothetical protein